MLVEQEVAEQEDLILMLQRGTGNTGGGGGGGLPYATGAGGLGIVILGYIFK